MSKTFDPLDDRAGWLKVAGSGIKLGQLTFEAQRAVMEAEVVFALVSNAPAMEMLRYYNANVVDLTSCYALERERIDTYREMAGKVLAEVRADKKVCFAIYGHPAVFAFPSRLALETARNEGYDVELLPGISAEDSMFCDLEIDPAVHGCQIYSATIFVRENRVFDPRAVLTLWQVSIIGESRLMESGDADYHRQLCDRLESVYGPSHPVILYEAATTMYFSPSMRAIAVSDLKTTKIRPCCTLVIPPIHCPDLVRVPLATEEPITISWPSSTTRA